MLLFKVGLLTLINIDSLIFLAIPCDRVILNMPGLNLKRHSQTNGHVNNNNYSNTPLSNNPDCPQSFNNAHLPSHLLGGSEHAHRTS